MTTAMTSQLSIATSFRNTEKENLYRLQYYISMRLKKKDMGSNSYLERVTNVYEGSDICLYLS